MSWDEEANNKLHENLSDLKGNPSLHERLSLKQETVLSRLRIGHTWITHSYILNREEMPFCVTCDCPFTVKHFLVECSDLTLSRHKYYKTTDMHTLFREVSTSRICDYLKDVGLYGKV